MRKLLMATAILALGVVAYGADKTASAPVRVRAEIVTGDITISDIDGRPILLDFGKIASSRTSDANAFVDYKIEYSGAYGADLQSKAITLVLGESTTAAKPDEVTLTNLDASLKDKNTMTANLKLDTYEATTPEADPKDDVIHTGRINGTLKAEQWKDEAAVAGVYEGQTQLTVTIAATE